MAALNRFQAFFDPKATLPSGITITETVENAAQAEGRLGGSGDQMGVCGI